MTWSWDEELPGVRGLGFEEVVLRSVAEEGEARTLERLLCKLDDLPIVTGHLYALALLPLPAALDWLEGKVRSPVVEAWGQTAALLGIRWDRIEAWLDRGRPHSLAALDALVACRSPPRPDLFSLEGFPVLADPPDPALIVRAVQALAVRDPVPRVEKTAAEIIEHVADICRGGPPGPSARERCGAWLVQRELKRLADEERWSVHRQPLPAPTSVLPPLSELRDVWRGRWQAAVEACARLGGETLTPLRLGEPLDAAGVGAIEAALGRPLPPLLRALFTAVAGQLAVDWWLPEAGLPGPPPFGEIFAGDCHWDARKLIELEATRSGWIGGVFNDPENPYDRVWQDKLAIMEVANGDLIAVDVSRPDQEPVVYLSHDGDDGHGRVLGHSVLDFIDRWTLLGCPGPEWWQLEPFLPDGATALEARGERADAWRGWLGLRLPA